MSSVSLKAGNLITALLVLQMSMSEDNHLLSDGLSTCLTIKNLTKVFLDIKHDVLLLHAYMLELIFFLL